MRPQTKLIDIQKNVIRKKKFTKVEIKKVILQSIIQNKNVKPIVRIKARYKLIRLDINSCISKQNNNICLQTGRIKGVLNVTQLSRHSLKKLAMFGGLQNMKIASW
jgi:ribosomal protein S14